MVLDSCCSDYFLNFISQYSQETGKSSKRNLWGLLVTVSYGEPKFVFWLSEPATSSSCYPRHPSLLGRQRCLQVPPLPHLLSRSGCQWRLNTSSLHLSLPIFDKFTPMKWLIRWIVPCLFHSISWHSVQITTMLQTKYITWKKCSKRDKHWALAVVMWSQKFSPHRRPPSREAWDGQNLISWRWSLPLRTNPVWWGSISVMMISSYCGNRPTHPHTNTPTHPPTPTDRTDYNTLHCS